MKLKVNDFRLGLIKLSFISECGAVTSDEMSFIGNAFDAAMKRHIINEDYFIGDYEDDNEFQQTTATLAIYMTDRIAPYLRRYLDKMNGFTINSFGSYEKTIREKTNEDYNDKSSQTDGANMSEVSPLSADTNFTINTPFTKNKGISNILENQEINKNENETIENEKENGIESIEILEKLHELNNELVSYIHSVFSCLIDEYSTIF